MTAPNLVNTDSVIAKTRNITVHNHHVRLLEVGSSDDVVVKINSMTIRKNDDGWSNGGIGYTGTDGGAVNVYLTTDYGTTKNYIAYKADWTDNAEEGEYTSLLESPLYIEPGTQVYAVLHTQVSDLIPRTNITYSYEILSDNGDSSIPDNTIEIVCLPEWEESNQVIKLRNDTPSVSGSVILKVPASGNVIETADITSPTISSFPHTESFTYNAQAVNTVNVNFAQDASSSEGNETMTIEAPNKEFTTFDILVKDTSKAGNDIFIGANHMFYGQHIGAVRWWLVDPTDNYTKIIELTDFAAGTWSFINNSHSSNVMAGTNSASAYQWTGNFTHNGQNINGRQEQTVFLTASSFRLVIMHIRWNIWQGDYCVDNLNIQNGNNLGTELTDANGNQFTGTVAFDVGTETGWGRNGSGTGNNTTSWEASLQAAAGMIANIPNAGTNAEAWQRRNVNTPSSSTGPQSGTLSSDGTTGNHAWNTPSGYFTFTETSQNNNSTYGRFYALWSPIYNL